ncbi:MAG: hypothetical protein KJT03_14615 [Verrucomicrobiae bacterium]|nr:hypothetical protein [Verrucomicrobiae bacterium]
MKAILLVFLLFAGSLLAVEPINPKDPKRFREQEAVVEKEISKLKKVEVPDAPGLYRAWRNPAKKLLQPSNDLRQQNVVTPSVKNPADEQTFLKNKEWKPGRVIHVYEKSKDFEEVLNPLSLRDFNRFVYQRNPKSP